MIVFATYVDNQEAIGYPINLVINSWGKAPRYLWCSDLAEKEYLYKFNALADFNPIGMKVRKPSDIAHIQNFILDKIVGHADFIVYCQADTYITEEGLQIIKDWCIERNLGSAMHLKCKHIRLFHECHSSYWGVTVIGKNSPKRFTGDGAYLEGETEILGSDYATVDIGYVSIDQYRRHLRQHEKTWDKKFDFLDLPDREFVQAVLEKDRKDVGLKSLIEPDSLLGDIIKQMGLVNEYAHLKLLL